MATYCYTQSIVVSLCVCLLVKFVSLTKTTEPIELPFGDLLE